MQAEARIPTTVLAGWLGAGKTTLLNRLLAGAGGRRLAVLVNEFGQLAVDDRLVVRTEENLVELSGGCVCCSVRGDLVEALERIHARARGGFLRRARPVDRVLIETTGLAEPAPIVQTFLAEENVRQAFRPPVVVTLVDARNAGRALAEPVAREQVAVADRLVVNKIDLVEPREVDTLVRRLVAMNPLAELERAEHARVDAARLLDAAGPAPPAARPTVEPAHDPGDIRAVALTESHPLDEMNVRLWLDLCVHFLRDRLLRCKGFLYVHGRPERLILQGVYDSWSTTPGSPWQPGERRATEVVFIGRDLDPAFLQRGLIRCRTP